MRFPLDILSNNFDTIDNKFTQKFDEGIYIIHPSEYVKICFPNTASKLIEDVVIFYLSFNLNRDRIREIIKLPFMSFKEEDIETDDYRFFSISYIDNAFKSIEIFDFESVIISDEIIYKENYYTDILKGIDKFKIKEKFITINYCGDKVHSIKASI